MVCAPKDDLKDCGDYFLVKVYGDETKYSDLPPIKPNFPGTGDIIAFKVSYSICESVTGPFWPLSVFSHESRLQEICT
jgi:hypothetical protein